MTFASKLGSVLIGLAATSTAAHALNASTFEKPDKTAISATTYGKTLPPIGYVEFCGRNEDECKFSGGKAEPLALNDAAWNQIRQVNNYVNTRIRPATDKEVYGVADYWTYPVDAGDCEDYVLLKKRYLEGLGISAEQLLITVVLDENSEGHAVLTVLTDKGDYVLDNRRQDILRWNDTGYTFLKRQSQEQANKWVSLQKAPTTRTTSQIPVGTRSN
jgi:predicted transglutaminase-like cysteine proteinase